MTRHPTANASQRARRARLPRIDYEPAPECLAIIRANLGRHYPDCILSGVIDRIVREWAQDRGQWCQKCLMRRLTPKSRFRRAQRHLPRQQADPMRRIRTRD